tara:strand:+ start:5665 stop:6255 length:591 start_codon:yes stop_codon:yes gene_type:complete
MRYKHDQQLIMLQPSSRYNKGIFKANIKQKAFPIQNRKDGGVKPESGTGVWTSTMLEEKEGCMSDWHRWMAWDMPSWIGHEGIRIWIKRTARIYMVDSVKDYNALIESYPAKVYSDNGWGQMVLTEEENYVDFVKMSQDFDIFWLTERGQVETRYGSNNLYGWDAESSLMLNNVIERFKKITIKPHTLKGIPDEAY